MSSTIEIDGKFLQPIKEVAELVSYSKDYITRLAREEKIVASNIGRQWFVNVDSLKAYAEASTIEQDIRKKQLSEERKQERELRGVVEKQNTLHVKRAQSFHMRAVVATSLVLSFGLLTGLATSQLISTPSTQQAQVFDIDELQTAPSSISVNNTSTDFETSENNINTVTTSYSEANEPTREVSSLGDVEDGILLMPSQGASSAETMFSDDVVIMTLSDGTKAVVQVDEEGNMSGNRVPFVTIPVEPKNI